MSECVSECMSESASVSTDSEYVIQAMSVWDEYSSE